MKPVLQTKFGSGTAPVSEQGNCFQAALASVLEIPLTEAFDLRGYVEPGEWWEPFLTWLAERGKWAAWLEGEPNPIPIPIPAGIHIIGCKVNGINHVAVVENNRVIHDPLGSISEQYEVTDLFLIGDLNPANRPA